MDNGEADISSYFIPKPNDIEKTNPENESDSDCEETVVAKRGRKFSFRDEKLREFTWLSGKRAAGVRQASASRRTCDVSAACSPFNSGKRASLAGKLTS
ncbi:hypothetical protein EYF80_058265 [Liparis tanakae]|uniref:Uncharacterized protein n=1 Tax=Liparis tanakae TaxID=230148 RepID=A0A4Z2ES21_9TELE|nr:hypothetical protein EYF80_058265 [Liparis tanakae]